MEAIKEARQFVNDFSQIREKSLQEYKDTPRIYATLDSGVSLLHTIQVQQHNYKTTWPNQGHIPAWKPLAQTNLETIQV